MDSPGIQFNNISSELEEIADCWDKVVNDGGSFHKLRSLLRTSSWVKFPHQFITLTIMLESEGLSLTEWLLHNINNYDSPFRAQQPRYSVESDPDNAYTKVRILLNDVMQRNTEFVHLWGTAKAQSGKKVQDREKRRSFGHENIVMLSAKLWFRMYLKRCNFQPMKIDSAVVWKKWYGRWCERDEILHSFHMFKLYLTEPIKGYDTKNRTRTFKEKDCRDLLKLILKDESSTHDLGDLLNQQCVDVSEMFGNQSGDLTVLRNQEQPRYSIIFDFMTATTAYHRTARKMPSQMDYPQKMREALVHAGFKYFDIDGRENGWIFPFALNSLACRLKEFCEQLEKRQEELSEFADDSSMMIFVGFYTHGVQGHIRDNKDVYVQYQDIVKLLNAQKALEAIPKLIFIQACAVSKDMPLQRYNFEDSVGTGRAASDYLDYKLERFNTHGMSSEETHEAIQAYMDLSCSQTVLIVSCSQGEETSVSQAGSLMANYIDHLGSKYEKTTNYLETIFRLVCEQQVAMEKVVNVLKDLPTPKIYLPSRNRYSVEQHENFYRKRIAKLHKQWKKEAQERKFLEEERRQKSKNCGYRRRWSTCIKHNDYNQVSDITDTTVCRHCRATHKRVDIEEWYNSPVSWQNARSQVVNLIVDYFF